MILYARCTSQYSYTGACIFHHNLDMNSVLKTCYHKNHFYSLKPILKIVIPQTRICVLLTEKNLPPFYFLPFHPRCHRANLGLGEFQCPKYPYSNTTLSLRIHDGTKPCGKKEGRKLNRAKKNCIKYFTLQK